MPKSLDSAPAARRLPVNYERIYSLVCELDDGQHRTAGELYAQATRRYPGMGFSTVYRGLTRLRDLGFVAEIIVPGASSAVYEKAAPSHAHFRCSSCGDVRDVAYSLSKRTLARIPLDGVGAVDDVSLTLHGTCRPCALRQPHTGKG